MSEKRLNRILLKLSGEALCGEVGGFGINPETLREVCLEIAEVHATGVQIAIVVVGIKFQLVRSRPIPRSRSRSRSR